MVPGQPIGLATAPQRDTSNRKQTSDWDATDARITAQHAFGLSRNVADTSISLLHRFPGAVSLIRDLGNLGSAAQPILWQPSAGAVGPSLGYHVFDAYRFSADSALFYNTTRPYSQFQYRMGFRLEQWVELLHTQNISPRWNFAARYRSIGSPGAFRTQRTNHDNASLSTVYASENKRYQLFGVATFNQEQQDENGGILGDSLLSDPRFADRQTIPVGINSAGYSIRRSPVYNNMRDATVQLRHRYVFGPRDTLYSADSTSYDTRITPRFAIGNRMMYGSSRHEYNDLLPDSARYLQLFNQRFTRGDSVFVQQRQRYFDQSAQLEGFIGKPGRQWEAAAGAGLRYDVFENQTPLKTEKFPQWNTYLTGTVSRDSLGKGNWHILANAQAYLLGPAAGSSVLEANAIGALFRGLNVTLGFRQQLGTVPFSWQRFQNDYYAQTQEFDKESSTLLTGGIVLPRYGVALSVRNWIVGNYLYLSAGGQLSQSAGLFQVTQGVVEKTFRKGIFVSANELWLQQLTGGGPVHVPLLQSRHTLGIETRILKNAVAIATGLEIRYHTPYEADGYSPLFNRFFYQSAQTVSNIPQGSAYLNFKVKRLRATISLDQLQQLIKPENVIQYPGYPAQSFTLRFGFVWTLIN